MHTLAVCWTVACSSKMVWTLFSSRFYQRETFKCLSERGYLFICYNHVLLKFLLRMGEREREIFFILATWKQELENYTPQAALRINLASYYHCMNLWDSTEILFTSLFLPQKKSHFFFSFIYHPTSSPRLCTVSLPKVTNNNKKKSTSTTSRRNENVALHLFHFAAPIVAGA